MPTQPRLGTIFRCSIAYFFQNDRNIISAIPLNSFQLSERDDVNIAKRLNFQAPMRRADICSPQVNSKILQNSLNYTPKCLLLCQDTHFYKIEKVPIKIYNSIPKYQS